MSAGRMARVKWQGRVYEIPEIWLMGQRAVGVMLSDAVKAWATQVELAERDTECAS